MNLPRPRPNDLALIRSRKPWTAMLLALATGCAQGGQNTTAGAPAQPVYDSVYDGTDRSWTDTEAASRLSQTALQAGDNTLSNQPWTAATSGWGPAERNASNGEYAAGDGKTLTLNGKTYATGLGVHSNSSLTFAIGGGCSALSADVGIDDEVGERGSAVFQVYGDGLKLYDSGVMTGSSATKAVNVDVAGRQELKLVVTDAGDNINYDHADWAGATLLGCGESGAVIRINAGGPEQTASGVRWVGCESADRCAGTVKGGFANTERPVVSGAQAPANAELYQSEWTGGQTDGVPAGGLAFAYHIPVKNGEYQVRLHFAELNKFAAGARLFDVRLEGKTVLTNFDVFREAGGAGRATVREFTASVADGAVDLDFIRQVENAKVSAIEVLPLGNAAPPTAAAQLSAQPARLVFSATQTTASAAQTVTLRNSGGSATVVRGVSFSGDTSAFGLVSPPAFPLTLAAGQSLDLSVRLLPGGPTGVLRAGLRAEGDSSATTSLTGLRALGLEGSLEPTLAQIVDALDYRVNVGGTGLLLGTGAGPIGDEVVAPLFERASAGPVTLRAVARYSPDGPSPYGSFVLDAGVPRTQPLGTLAAGGYQTLNPPLEAGSRSSFDPGSQPFGIYLAANSYAEQNTYSLDSVNTGRTRHAARVYPLKDSAGNALPGSYLLGFEPAVNGDYQDVVFVLENVRPVVAPSSSGTANQAFKWLSRADAPTTLYEGQGAAVNSQLYVFGGFDKNVNDRPIATRAARAYDPATDRWRTLRDIPDLLTHAGVAVDGQNIYLAGGFLGDHPGPQTDHVWQYSVSQDTWSAMPPLPGARGGGALVRLGRDLHFFGGVLRNAGGDYERDSGDHWVLNLDSPAGWRSAASMPNPRNHIAGAALNGLVYAIGGQHLGDEQGGNQADVDVYDPGSNTWRAVSPLPLPLGHATASTVVWNGRLVVAGGVTQGNREVTNVSEYDPATNRWSALSALPGPRQSPVADVIGGQLVLTTGSTGDGPTNSTWISQR